MTESTDEPPPFGSLKTQGNETNFSASCTALATVGTSQNDTVMLASIVGPQSTVKAFRATLNNSRSMILLAQGCGPCTPRCDVYYRTDGVYGYSITTARLGFDSWHLLAISDDPRFIPCYSQRAVLAKLMSQSFTTPILEGWISHICGDLRRDGLLKQVPSYNCNAGMLTATDKVLDLIVERGVKGGKLKISQECAHV